MLKYNYNAKNINGKEIYGQIQGQNRLEIAAILKRKGLYILTIEPQSKFSAIFKNSLCIASTVSTKDKAVFTHQLAVLLKAGMNLSPALNTLAKQSTNKNLKAAISHIHNDIEQSNSLSQAMAKHPKIFSKVYTAVIEASEQASNLADTLSVLTSQLKKQASVNSSIRSALAYPLFLLAVSTLVVGVLMTFVIPKFIALFVNADQALPLPTKILAAITDLLKDQWYTIFLILLGIICLFITALKNRRVKIHFDTLLLNLPLAGSLNRKIQTARLTRTFGSLLKSGVDILKALETTKKTTANLAYKMQISVIEQKILKGFSVANAMQEQKYFNDVTISMTAIGEQTGTLPDMLLETADMYDQQSETMLSSMTTLLGPLLILILGLIIGFIVLAILMPIFQTSAIIG